MKIYLYLLVSLSYSITNDYPKGVESIGSYTVSPIILNIEGGGALGLIEIPDATIDIYITGVPPMKFTKEDNVALFTFKNNATAIINFQTVFSYFITTSPNQVKFTGAILYISNLNTTEFSFTNVNKDIYLSFVDEYTLKGEVSASASTINFEGIERINDENNRFQEEYSQKNFEYSPFMFSSKFIRKSGSSSLTISGKATCFESFIPDVPTTYTETWEKVDKNTVFAKDCAFGGENGIIQIPLDDESEFVSIINQIIIDNYLKVAVKFSSKEVTRIVEKNKKFIYGNENLMIVEVYFNNEICTDELITTYTSSKSREIKYFTYYDVPDKCKPNYGLPPIPQGATHFLFFNMVDISDDKKIEFVISFDNGKRYEIPHGYIELGSTEKFTVTVYVTVPNLCSQLKYLTFKSIEDKSFFILNDEMIMMCADKEGLSEGAIAGIVIACVVVVAAIIVGIVIWKVRTHKKQINKLNSDKSP